MIDPDVVGALRSISGTRTVMVGVGNVLRGDDGLGPELMRLLDGAPGLACIDAGTTPENQVGAIAGRRPGTVLIADAVDLGLAPGSVAVLDRDAIVRFSGLGTHDISPAMFMERLEEETRATVRMLAVQPSGLAFGSPLSDAVASVLEELATLLRELFRPGAPASSR